MRTVSLVRLVVPATICFTVLVAVVPVPTSVHVQAVKYSGLQLTALLWTVLVAFGVITSQARDRLPLAASAALVLVMIVSTAFSYDPLGLGTYGGMFYWGLTTWVAAIAVLVGCSLADIGEGERTALNLGLLVTGAVASLSMFEFVTGSPVSGGFDNSNHLVFGLAVVPSVALGASRVATGFWRVALPAVGVASLAACIVSGSAAGALAATVGVASLLVFWPSAVVQDQRSQRLLRRIVAGSALVVMGIIGVGLATGYLPETIDQPLRSRLVGTNLTGRYDLWRAGLEATAASPILGVGADGYSVAGQGFVSRDGQLREPATELMPRLPDPHNMLVLVTVSFGVLGLLTAAGLFIAYARRLRSPGRARIAAEPLHAGLVSGAVSWLVVSLFVPNSIEWTGFPAMILGLAVATSPGDRGDDLQGRVRVGLRVLASVLCLVFAVAAISSGVASYWTYRASHAEGRQAYTEAVSHASAWQPTMAFYKYLAIDTSIQPTTVDEATIRRYQRRVDGAGPGINEDARYVTLLVRASLDQAWASGRTDVSWESKRLDWATSAGPNLPDVLLENAHLALVKRDVKTAVKWLKAAEPFNPHLKRAIVYYYFLAVITGDQANAQMLLERAQGDSEALRLMVPSPSR